MKQKKSTIYKFLFAALIVFGALTFLTSMLFKQPQSDEDLKVDLENMELVQLNILEGKVDEKAPQAIITTSFGEMRAVLFPEYAPETVDYFVELAQSGHYDGTYVFNIQPDVYWAGGSVDKHGALEEGYDKEKETLPIEYHDNLWPLKGALCSYGQPKKSLFGGSTLYGGSRFVAVNSIDFTEEEKTQLLAVNEEDTRIADAFIKYGGIPNFTRQMTVFAQVYEGLDIIDKICSEETGTEAEENIPVSDIIIDKIEIINYTKPVQAEAEQNEE